MSRDADVAFASLTEISARLRAGELSSAELLELYLARIDRHARLNAVVTLDERAREWAEERDREAAGGRLRGPLHGVAMTVKDSLETAGLRTTSGAEPLAGHVPERDAAVVARLRSAGAVVFGKTNLPPWAGDMQTDNTVFGRTLNPWADDRSPGGSSGGAAAAVAAGLTAAELGSDIGGSIRQPAANCGVFGLKPSWGIVPARGHIPGPPGTLAEPDVAAIGPIARSADDLELLLDVVAGAEGERGRAWRVELPPARVERIAFWFDDPDHALDSEVRAALEAAARELGAEPFDPGTRLNDALRLYYRLQAPLLSLGESDETVAEWRAAAATRPEPHAHSSEAWRHWGGESHREWLAANEERARLQARWAEAAAAFDAILLPVTPAAAQVHQSGGFEERSVLIDGSPHSWRVLSPWLWLIGVLHLPAVAAPVGFTREGMPIGLQVVGRYGGDRDAIEVARRIGRYVPPPLYV